MITRTTRPENPSNQILQVSGIFHSRSPKTGYIRDPCSKQTSNNLFISSNIIEVVSSSSFYLGYCTHLDGRLTSRFIWQKHCQDTSKHDHAPRNVYGHRCRQIRVQCNHRCLLIPYQRHVGRVYEMERRTITPNTRVAVAVSPFPVPRSLAGNISGDMAYRTPYIIYPDGERSSSKASSSRTHVTAKHVATVPPQKLV